MDAFVDAYFAVDTDGKGFITTPDLRRHMVRHNYEEAFIKKWIDLFDEDKSGTIEFEEYCHVLGLEPKNIIKERGISMSGGVIPTDVMVISVEMDMSRQLMIIEIAREALKMYSNEQDMTKYIKQTLDSRVGKLWHVIIIQGQFWSWYSHAPHNSFIFRLANYIFIIFRTPFE